MYIQARAEETAAAEATPEADDARPTTGLIVKPMFCPQRNDGEESGWPFLRNNSNNVPDSYKKKSFMRKPDSL
jgi:hypothetical protein